MTQAACVGVGGESFFPRLVTVSGGLHLSQTHYGSPAFCYIQLRNLGGGRERVLFFLKGQQGKGAVWEVFMVTYLSLGCGLWVFFHALIL